MSNDTSAGAHSNSVTPGIAIVTGASAGVGRAAALALLAAGWSVALAGRREAALEETARMAGGAAANALAVPADISDPDAVDALFARTVERFGRVDLLFNNAGSNVPAVPIDELTVEQWRMVVDVNLTGAFLCTRAAVRQMKQQTPRGGRIINNGSVSAHTPRPMSTPYTATKHAISGLTKCTSLDGRAFDIACGQIDIGNAVTEMTERMTGGVPQADGSMRPEPRMPVAYVAKAVVDMANLPLDVNVQTMTIMATNMPFVGRG